MLNNSTTETSHKGVPIENWDHFNERLLGLPTGQHTIEIFMRAPDGGLSYVSQEYWIQKLDDAVNFDLEVCATAACSSKLDMGGPEDISFYVIEILSEKLDIREKYSFETKDRDWIMKLAKQAYDGVITTADTKQVIQEIIDKSSADNIKYQQMHFKVFTDM